MKKIIKSRIFTFILGAIIFGSIGVYAATQYTASQITYNKNGKATVDAALNDLYGKTPKKFCELKSGTEYAVGAKYECDPGDGTKRNFYILAIDNNKVKLIMDRNITHGSSTTTITWMNAMVYFDTGAGSSTKSAWTNVLDIDLPMAQDIANAVNNGSWKVGDKDYDGWFYFDKNGNSYGQTQVANSSNLSNYKWLFNYTRECSSYGCDSDTSLSSSESSGYWTRDLVAQLKDSTGRAWGVDSRGFLDSDYVSDVTNNGVRPVITVLKSNLYKKN